MVTAASAVDASVRAAVAPAPQPVATVGDLRVTFRRNGCDVAALRGVSLAIAPGEILGLVGESGSGKSVLGFTLLGLLPKTAKVDGTVRVAGADMVRGEPKELRKVRRLDLGAVFQDPMTSLNPTVIALGLSAPAFAQPKADAGSGPTNGAVSTNDAGSGPTKGAKPKTGSTAASNSMGSNSMGSTENSAGASPGPKSTGGSQPVTPGMPEKKQ